MLQSFVSIHVHAIFSTQGRIPYLADPFFRSEMHAYLGGISRSLKCTPIAVGGPSDHIHILMKLEKMMTVPAWIKEVKRSSSIFAKDFSPQFAWQSGYAAYGVDGLIHYIENQETHHAKVSFQDELRNLLREQGIDFDERYLWD